MPKIHEEDKDKATSRNGVTIAVRLAPIEVRALKELIALEQAEIEERGAPYRASPASILRTLLKAQAVSKGVWVSAPAKDATPAPTPAASASQVKPRSSRVAKTPIDKP